MRDGFVAVKNVLVGKQLRRTQEAADRVIGEIVDADPERVGNRGHHRYSFSNRSSLGMVSANGPAGRAAYSFVVWGSEDYVCFGNGGDFSLPGAEIQPLHSDGNELGFIDPLGQTTTRDLPPALICVNFPMIDFTEENNAIRQIPCTSSSAPIPTLEEEPPWMKKASFVRRLALRSSATCAAGTAARPTGRTGRGR